MIINLTLTLTNPDHNRNPEHDPNPDRNLTLTLTLLWQIIPISRYQFFQGYIQIADLTL